MDKYKANQIKDKVISSIDNPAGYGFLSLYLSVVLDEMKLSREYREEGNNKLATQKFNHALHALDSLRWSLDLAEEKYWKELEAGQPAERSEHE